MFNVCGQMQQVLLVALLWMHGGDGKLSVGQRAGLVEDHRPDLRQDVQVVGAFHQDSFA